MPAFSVQRVANGDANAASANMEIVYHKKVSVSAGGTPIVVQIPYLRNTRVVYPREELLLPALEDTTPHEPATKKFKINFQDK